MLQVGMIKIHHECGYEKEVEFLCPKCGKPICSEDTQQSIGGMIVGHAVNHIEIRKLQLDLKDTNAKLKLLKEFVERCRFCRKAEIDPEFYKELVEIKGIGESTAKDIVTVYPTRDLLIYDIKMGNNIPFESDVVKLLEEKYGI